MRFSILTRPSRLFMAIALLLTTTLFLGLLGIGGLVVLRSFAGPVEVAKPMPIEEPSSTPVRLATPTSATLPAATSTSVSVPTATLVVPLATVTPAGEAPADGPGQDGPGMSSPVSEPSGMPETGLGPLETLVVGLTLIGFLSGARIARRMWMDGRA